MMLTSVSIAAVLLLLSGTGVAAAAAPPEQIGMPNCTTTCGNVSVPYPFGMGASHCYWPGFNLTCDRTSNPPRLLLGYDDTLRVAEIFLSNNSVRVVRTGSIINSTTSEDRNATFGTSFMGFMDEESPYSLAYGNELILTGCNVQAILLGFGNDDGDDNNIISGCASFCSDSDFQFRGIADSQHDKFCSGLRCCQARVSPGFSLISCDPRELRLRWFNRNHSRDLLDQPVRVFIAEDWWFDQRWVSDQLVENPLPPSRAALVVPILLWWGVAQNLEQGNVDMFPNCSAEVARSLCKSKNSLCQQEIETKGYTCKCSKGYDGNPYVTDGCKDVNECERPGDHGCFGDCTDMPGTFLCKCPKGFHGNHSIPNGCVKTVNTGLNVGIGVGIGAGVVLLILTAILMIRKLKLQRARKLRKKFFKQNRGQLLQQLVSQRADITERMIITLKELEKATNNFDKARELGGGGHGIVYKGILSDLHVVAIKKPKMMVQKEIDEFINEVAILSQINHRNVVKLYGCCLETEVPMLVYEFISNGTLCGHLHVEGSRSLSWGDRLRIAIETAKSLAYLHSAASVPIIHRDIKSTNILLDDNLTAKVADFGASRYVPLEKSGVTTMVQGTIGYLDPAYFYTWRLTEKSDVFSFGVILIELLTRKKPFSYMSSQGDGLVAHFVSLFAAGNLSQILDPQVMEEGDKEVEEVATLAVACIKLKGEDRPTMRQVELTLESLQSPGQLSSVVAVQLEQEGSAINGASRGSEESTRHYSMEEEFVLSASYPR